VYTRALDLAIAGYDVALARARIVSSVSPHRAMTGPAGCSLQRWSRALSIGVAVGCDLVRMRINR
jgi:hypothetical protein